MENKLNLSSDIINITSECICITNDSISDIRQIDLNNEHGTYFYNFHIDILLWIDKITLIIKSLYYRSDFNKMIKFLKLKRLVFLMIIVTFF